MRLKHKMRLEANCFQVIVTTLHREKKSVGASAQGVTHTARPSQVQVLPPTGSQASVDLPCHLPLTERGTILLFVLVLIVPEADLDTNHLMCKRLVLEVVQELLEKGGTVRQREREAAQNDLSSRT